MRDTHKNKSKRQIFLLIFWSNVSLIQEYNQHKIRTKSINKNNKIWANNQNLILSFYFSFIFYFIIYFGQ